MSKALRTTCQLRRFSTKISANESPNKSDLDFSSANLEVAPPPRASYEWPSNTWGESDRHSGWRGGNWSGTVRWVGSSILEPSRLEELQEAVSQGSKLRAVGSAHSFTPVVGLGDSDSTKAHKATPSNFDDMQLVSFRKMPRIFDLDQKRKTLTVDAGSTYSEVCAALSSTGLALPNTASLPQFGVAGAVATGTHGSSGLGKDGRLVRSGLADAVLRMEIVGPDGEIRSLSRGDEGFSASVVSLGCMGMVTSVTLELVDDFDVFQRVYGAWPPETAEGGLSAMLESLPLAMRECGAGSFSLFVDWAQDSPGTLILRSPIPPTGSEREAAAAAARLIHQAPRDWLSGNAAVTAPLLTSPIEAFIEGVAYDTSGVGRWHDKLHVWMKDAKPLGPQSAPELQLEHFVPLKHAKEVLELYRLVGAHFGSSILYTEIRAVRADDQLLSPYSCDEADGFDSLGISTGLHAGIGESRVIAAASVIEEALEQFRPKPHWGKLMGYGGQDLENLYGDRLKRWRRERERVDPNRKFCNAWVEKMLLNESIM